MFVKMMIKKFGLKIEGICGKEILEKEKSNDFRIFHISRVYRF
jgi:nucleoside-triphosphatase THEP1